MSNKDPKRAEPTTPGGDTDSQLLITPQQVADLLQVSTRSLWRMRSAGKLPPPVKLGASVRWRRDEIEQWVKDGCPIQDRRIDGFRSR